MATSKKNTKLENCEVCQNKAKYTCPKCEVRTCCLACVNIHKKELKCDGIRNKTKFIPLSSFTDSDIMSDYLMLEEIKMVADKCSRDPRIRDVELPKFLHKLKKAASQRKVNLEIMPKIFSRRKENTTFLDWKSNELFWRIEWIFPQAENLKHVSERVLDAAKLSNILKRIWNSVEYLKSNCETEELHSTLKFCDRLQYYRSADICGVYILLKAERVPNASNKFYELDPRLTIRENLENKTIVEFPTIHVVLRDHKYMYDIIDPDECTEEPVTVQEENVKCNEDNKNKSTNFSFNIETSESDN